MHENWCFGVLIATIFVMIFIYFPWETWVLFKHLFKCSAKEYIAKLLYYLIITIIAAFMTSYLCEYVPGEGILSILMKGIICAVVPNIILIAFSNLTEFKDGKKRVFTILQGKMK